mgnify:CR=1 FL=1
MRGGIEDSLKRMRKAGTLDRNIRIYEDRLKGFSLSEIGRPLNITKQRVEQILNNKYLKDIYERRVNNEPNSSN